MRDNGLGRDIFFKQQLKSLTKIFFLQDLSFQVGIILVPTIHVYWPLRNIQRCIYLRKNGKIVALSKWSKFTVTYLQFIKLVLFIQFFTKKPNLLTSWCCILDNGIMHMQWNNFLISLSFSLLKALIFFLYNQYMCTQFLHAVLYTSIQLFEYCIHLIDPQLVLYNSIVCVFVILCLQRTTNDVKSLMCNFSMDLPFSHLGANSLKTDRCPNTLWLMSSHLKI